MADRWAVRPGGVWAPFVHTKLKNTDKYQTRPPPESPDLLHHHYLTISKFFLFFFVRPLNKFFAGAFEALIGRFHPTNNRYLLDLFIYKTKMDDFSGENKKLLWNKREISPLNGRAGHFCFHIKFYSTLLEFWNFYLSFIQFYVDDLGHGMTVALWRQHFYLTH